MTRKKYFISILTLLFGLFTLTPMITAAQGPNFELKTVQTNSGIKITVIGHHLTDLYAFDLTLQYDAKRLKFKEFSTPMSGFSVDPIIKDNSIRAAHTMIGKIAGIDGDKEIATFTFDHISAGSANITLTDIVLINSKLDETIIHANVKAISVDLIDINGHWAEANIRKAVSLGFVSGYTDATFKPQREATRAEFSVMLTKALGIESSGTPTAFKDAIPAWAAPSIEAATQHQLISGYPDQTFRPNEIITREEMATIVVRALNIDIQADAELTFADADQTAAWAKPYVAAAKDLGIIQGKGNNLFAPKASATRAEAVSIILAVLNQLK